MLARPVQPVAAPWASPTAPSTVVVAGVTSQPAVKLPVCDANALAWNEPPPLTVWQLPGFPPPPPPAGVVKLRTPAPLALGPVPGWIWTVTPVASGVDVTAYVVFGDRSLTTLRVSPAGRWYLIGVPTTVPAGPVPDSTANVLLPERITAPATAPACTVPSVADSRLTVAAAAGEPAASTTVTHWFWLAAAPGRMSIRDTSLPLK